MGKGSSQASPTWMHLGSLARYCRGARGHPEQENLSIVISGGCYRSWKAVEKACKWHFELQYPSAVNVVFAEGGQMGGQMEGSHLG